MLIGVQNQLSHSFAFDIYYVHTMQRPVLFQVELLLEPAFETTNQLALNNILVVNKAKGSMDAMNLSQYRCHFENLWIASGMFSKILIKFHKWL